MSIKAETGKEMDARFKNAVRLEPQAQFVPIAPLPFSPQPPSSVKITTSKLSRLDLVFD